LGFNAGNPPTSPSGSEVLFNQAQDQLLVSVKGNSLGIAQGTIRSYLVGSIPFSLAATPVISYPKNGLKTFSMTLAGNNAVFNTDPAFGVDVSTFDSTGHLISTTNTTIPGQLGTCWSSFSPRTGSFYVTDGGQPLVTEFSVNTAIPSATIIAHHTYEGSLGRTDQVVGSTSKGDFLYILGGAAGVVDVIALTAPGTATEVQSFNFAAAVPGIGNNVQGMAVYAT
jgi:hypothetical protein